MQTHQTIVYDQADLNLGNGYNKANGKFTTPMNGTYVFHVATGAIDQSHASVELVVNGIIKDVGWADSMDHADRSFATTATPVSLKQGDVVLARIGSKHFALNIYLDFHFFQKLFGCQSFLCECRLTF
jgi:hypothetical protein